MQFISIPLSLYEQDYHLWIEEQIRLLKDQDWSQLDLKNLIEELEDMGRSERRAIKSNLVIVLLHLLKYQFQPEHRSQSWQASLIEHRLRLRDDFEESPSLRQLMQDAPWLKRCYEDACKRASQETGLPYTTFPTQCPYSPQQMLNESFLPKN